MSNSAFDTNDHVSEAIEADNRRIEAVLSDWDAARERFFRAGETLLELEETEDARVGAVAARDRAFTAEEERLLEALEQRDRLAHSMLDHGVDWIVENTLAVALDDVDEPEPEEDDDLDPGSHALATLSAELPEQLRELLEAITAGNVGLLRAAAHVDAQRELYADLADYTERAHEENDSDDDSAEIEGLDTIWEVMGATEDAMRLLLGRTAEWFREDSETDEDRD